MWKVVPLQYMLIHPCGVDAQGDVEGYLSLDQMGVFETLKNNYK